MWVLIQARSQAQLWEAPEPAGMVDTVLRPDLEENIECFLGHLGGVLKEEVEFLELPRTHPLADAEIEASARQIVQHGGLSSQPQGMMKRQDVDIIAEP